MTTGHHLFQKFLKSKDNEALAAWAEIERVKDAGAIHLESDLSRECLGGSGRAQVVGSAERVVRAETVQRPFGSASAEPSAVFRVRSWLQFRNRRRSHGRE